MSYHDLTLKDIAVHTQNAVSTVGTWKQGRMPSSSETMVRLAEIFQVSVSFLRDGLARPMEAPCPNKAEQILNDIETLMAELNAKPANQPHYLREEQAVYQESSQLESPGSREEMVSYFQRFLTEAERHPDGLAYAWYQLRREFPQNLYGKLRQK